MNRINKLACVLSLGVSFQAALAADIKPVDSIVAVVDNAVITRQELSNEVSQMRHHQPKGNSASAADLQQQALQQLVNRNLLAQAAQRAGITVSMAEIDAEAARIAPGKKNIGSAARHSIADKLMAQKMEQSVLMEQGKIGDAEIDAAIARAQQQGIKLPEGMPSYQYHVQHILIKDDTEASRKLVNQLQTQARSGASFAQLARQYSQDGSAAQGGDLGWISEGQTVAPFEAAVKALKPGQISAPVRSQFGWHIIRLEEVKSAATPQERQRNGVRRALVEEKSAAALQDLLRQLHEQAFIQIRQ